MVIGANSIFTAVAALVAVLALIWLAGRAARVGGMARRPAASGSLVIQDVLALDSRRQLHLVSCDGRRVLLLTGGPQDIVVGWPDRQEQTP